MDALTQLQQALEPFQGDDVPGLALAVVAGGEVVYRQGHGMAVLPGSTGPEPRPIEPDTIFDLGSTSKQFTAACLLLLEDEGALSLEDDVRETLPELRHEETVRLRHLLHHTHGVRDYLELLEMAGARHGGVTPDEVLDLLARQRRLNFTPGDRFSYSNSGYFLLGRVLERVTGEPLADLARRRLFEPLGMSATGFVTGPEPVPGQAVGYVRDGAAVRPAGADANLPGDGALRSSLDDLVRWGRLFDRAEPDASGLGGPRWRERMEAPGRLDDGTPLSYAAGLYVTEHRGTRRVYHAGTWAGHGAELLRLPDLGVLVACLTNSPDVLPEALALRVAEGLCADRLAPVAVAAPKAPAPEGTDEAGAPDDATLERLAGTYRSSESGLIWTLARAGEGLEARSAFTFRLAPAGPDRLRSVDAPEELTMTWDGDDAAPRLTWTLAGRPPVALVRVEPAAPEAPGDEGPDEYVGGYHSEELGLAYRLTRDGEALRMHMPTVPVPLPLEPTVADEFVTRGVTLRFTRDGAGRVDGFGVDSGRVKGLRFDRSEAS
jgi:CubicO group peptidase (beta-lactamase class C family)